MPIYYGDVEKRPVKYTSSAPSAGGVIASTEDVMNFLQYFFKGELFNTSHLTESQFLPIQFFPIQYGSGMMKVEMNALMNRSFRYNWLLWLLSEILIVGTINQIKTQPFAYIYGYINAIKKSIYHKKSPVGKLPTGDFFKLISLVLLKNQY